MHPPPLTPFPLATRCSLRHVGRVSCTRGHAVIVQPILHTTTSFILSHGSPLQVCYGKQWWWGYCYVVMVVVVVVADGNAVADADDADDADG